MASPRKGFCLPPFCHANNDHQVTKIWGVDRHYSRLGTYYIRYPIKKIRAMFEKKSGQEARTRKVFIGCLDTLSQLIGRGRINR